MPDPKKPKLPIRDARLEDVLTDKQPVLHPEDSVQEAGDKMREMGTDSLPVTEGRHLVGSVDQCHPDRRAAGFGHDPNDVTVSAIMTDAEIYCFEDDDCAEALRKMNERAVDRMPVVDREMRVVGVVTRADLLAQE